MAPKTKASQDSRTPQAAKEELRQRGETIKSFADENGFPYRTVQAVLSGTNKGHHGEAHKVAVALGLK